MFNFIVVPVTVSGPNGCDRCECRPFGSIGGGTGGGTSGGTSGGTGGGIPASGPPVPSFCQDPGCPPCFQPNMLAWSQNAQNCPFNCICISMSGKK